MKNNNAFARRLLVWTGGGSGGGGGGGVDIKVKVSAADTTTDYLSSKLSSSDGTVTFTILNPGGDEEYDVSIAPIPLTVAAAQAAITGSSLLPGRMYLITDAYGGTCQVFLWAVGANVFDQEGWGYFSNTNTASREAFMKYDVVSDKLYEAFFPKINVRIAQSINPNTGSANGNAMNVFPVNAAIFNVSIVDSNFSGSNLSNPGTINISNCSFDVCVIVFNQNGVVDLQVSNFTFTYLTYNNTFSATANFIINSVFNRTTINVTGTGNIAYTECWTGTINLLNSNALSGCYIYNGAVVTLDNSTAQKCSVFQNGVLTLDGSIFINCKVGMGKSVVPAAGYNATNGFLENLDSTFEVFLNPDISGVIDMNDYKFAGVVRIGTSGAPASWELKELQNFPTDHIFCIVPADSNTVDVYDAGAGGGNLYLNVAAVVTYDGTKDDTLVVRSGLNDYTRVFQIGGWQAPSA